MLFRILITRLNFAGYPLLNCDLYFRKLIQHYVVLCIPPFADPRATTIRAAPYHRRPSSLSAHTYHDERQELCWSERRLLRTLLRVGWFAFGAWLRDYRSILRSLLCRDPRRVHLHPVLVSSCCVGNFAACKLLRRETNFGLRTSLGISPLWTVAKRFNIAVCCRKKYLELMHYTSRLLWSRNLIIRNRWDIIVMRLIKIAMTKILKHFTDLFAKVCLTTLTKLLIFCPEFGQIYL